MSDFAYWSDHLVLLNETKKCLRFWAPRPAIDVALRAGLLARMQRNGTLGVTLSLTTTNLPTLRTLKAIVIATSSAVDATSGQFCKRSATRFKVAGISWLRSDQPGADVKLDPFAKTDMVWGVEGEMPYVLWLRLHGYIHIPNRLSFIFPSNVHDAR